MHPPSLPPPRCGTTTLSFPLSCLGSFKSPSQRPSRPQPLSPPPSSSAAPRRPARLGGTFRPAALRVGQHVNVRRIEFSM